MKNLIPFLFAALMFAGCEKIEGQLNVTKEVRIRTTKGVVRTLKVGTYTADIQANTKKKITLRLNNDGDEKYEFNIPNGSIPENGSFAFNSDTVGQPVDLKGTVKTTVTQTDTQQGTQSCQYQTSVHYCYPSGTLGGISCSTRWETRFGTQWIQYYDKRTTKDVALSIAATKTTDEAAQFQGDIVLVDRIVISQNSCM